MLNLDQRTLVLDYLCHNCNTKTARAFARDSAVRHLDADGDEIHPDGLDASSSADLTNETLRLVDLRQRQYLSVVSLRTWLNTYNNRDTHPHTIWTCGRSDNSLE